MQTVSYYILLILGYFNIGIKVKSGKYTGFLLRVYKEENSEYAEHFILTKFEHIKFLSIKLWKKRVIVNQIYVHFVIKNK